MRPRGVIIAAVLLAVLSGAVWYAQRHPQSTETKTGTAAAPKLLDIPEAQLGQFSIQKKGSAPVTLDRRNGKWMIVTPEQMSADQDAVNAIASSLSPITADSIVEDKVQDASKYGLATPSLVVTVKRKDGKSDSLQFGDDVPAGSLVYAEMDSMPKVYALSSTVRTSFDKTLNDLRDKRLLTFDSNQLTRLALATGKGDVEFAKTNGNDWQIVKPKPLRADNFQVEELLRKLTDAKMDLSGNADTTRQTETAYASGLPVGTARATDANGTQTLEMRKNKDDYYAHSSVVKGNYKVATDLGKEFEKSLPDFRNKKVFDFGFTDPNKLEIHGTGSDKSYTKSGQDWKFEGKTMDAASIQAFIDKLRDLTAAQLVDTGFTKPVFEFTVTSNDGKRVEKVAFAKVAGGYIARRVNETSLYKLDAKVVDDALKAGNDVKPAPATPKK